ncbi:minichromosome maintenance- protein [Saccharomyces cerevisiae]|uniref:K7_Mcm16p n=1 Tax=Saccharomyces cerevisiae (strain Kyokai no. 7 / NBRC 101557) TaxID=721032 RepID=G2WPM2_YEASK|nr:Mcm16p [Saccharomyces cerevisiae YJM1460]AJV93993.1 Mcm16p [Saccharomyces cerevisiae YJM1549]AJV95134.1 Mcm16p [Saccharomyces cerevisiae YJM1592]AJV99325.1 Mcm16p [Saccharomyces cerevisiae YJM326]AJW01495.1 Mcm16p [Saccharomyces cerevisiae YJM1383]AJW03214.1 Mcm16p [Saccharomyces cerevisiae YJM1388]AJW03651.1 Mcm16p [Saccharomyces cerevisiae YJM1389]AJW10620.1 Mcm16p [Saccharomyces cerevisiae YJM1083]AJW11330.1 Mcm16p [Saccharomyces cerevisiae YJM1133]AJW17417.1 Mcm16p [Saccharomyces ce
MTNSSEKQWERIQQLEKEHVEVYRELLITLDRLYLIRKHNHAVILSHTQQRLLEIRHQLQINLEKTALLIRLLEKPDNTNVLFTKLQNLLEESNSLDYELLQSLGAQSSLHKQLIESRAERDELMSKLIELSSKFPKPTIPPDDGDTAGKQVEVEKENETIQELMIALQIHSGYTNISYTI